MRKAVLGWFGSAASPGGIYTPSPDPADSMYPLIPKAWHGACPAPRRDAGSAPGPTIAVHSSPEQSPRHKSKHVAPPGCPSADKTVVCPCPPPPVPSHKTQSLEARTNKGCSHRQEGPSAARSRQGRCKKPALGEQHVCCYSPDELPRKPGGFDSY